MDNSKYSCSMAGCQSRMISDDFVVGMAYVPWQKWRNIYEPCKALARGTLFPVLDKPFEKGGRCQ